MDHISKFTRREVYEVEFTCNKCEFVMHGYVLHPHEANKKAMICPRCKKRMQNTEVKKMEFDDDYL